jgi:hypothetical protein
MAAMKDTTVIIVADNDADEHDVPPGILKMLGPNSVLMSNDSKRMYVRRSHWEAMKDSFALANK